MQIVVVESIEKGLERAKEELYNYTDNKTVIFFSGGKTPKPLYEVIAKEEIIKPAAVAMVDERYGQSMHENSNEKMIAETGLTRYFSMRDIPFHRILQKDLSREEATQQYDETVRKLFFHVPKSVGILGIGVDGHTAGIAPNRNNFTNTIFDGSRKHLFVDSFNDSTGPFGERITLTFAGLTLLDFMIVIAFGTDKKHALQAMFEQGPIEEIPARFYTQPEISKKTIVITDQRV